MLLNLSLNACFDVLDLTVDERTKHPLARFEKLLDTLKLEYLSFDLIDLTMLSVSNLATKSDVEKCYDYLKSNQGFLKSLLGFCK